MNAKQAKKEERVKLCAEVIAYLNKEADRLFKPDTPGTSKLFTAEWGHKYGWPQYKGVIDYLVLRWKDDPKMNSFLKPATLFGPEKFPEYLAEARSLIRQERNKKRIIPFSKYLPVIEAESKQLIPYSQYDPTN